MSKKSIVSYDKGATKYDINSFKMRQLSSKWTTLMNNLRNECLSMIKIGPDIKVPNKKGLTIAIESPKCCINYAEMNYDRNVPLRQYFGLQIKKDKTNNDVFRYSYGVGSGESTVGGDVETTTTKPLTKIMVQICKELEKLDELKKWTKAQKKMSTMYFNHVTILYYIMDNHEHRKIELKPHCDLEVTATNKVKKGNSQVEGTPTVVISLQSDKKVNFYKRYTTVDQKKFEDKLKLVHEFNMKDGDMFVLHPKDERVHCRKVWDNNSQTLKKEDCASQFKHGVKCTIDKGMNRKLSISVCFRQVSTFKQYCPRNNTIIERIIKETKTAKETGKENTIAEKRREELMDSKRKIIHKPRNLQRIKKRNMKYYNVAVEQKKARDEKSKERKKK